MSAAAGEDAAGVEHQRGDRCRLEDHPERRRKHRAVPAREEQRGGHTGDTDDEDPLRKRDQRGVHARVLPERAPAELTARMGEIERRQQRDRHRRWHEEHEGQRLAEDHRHGVLHVDDRRRPQRLRGRGDAGEHHRERHRVREHQGEEPERAQNGER
jgi:hypothetical protein